jgi:hypothetical protein
VNEKGLCTEVTWSNQIIGEIAQSSMKLKDLSAGDELLGNLIEAYTLRGIMLVAPYLECCTLKLNRLWAFEPSATLLCL